MARETTSNLIKGITKEEEPNSAPVKIFTRFKPEDVVLDKVQYETEGLFYQNDPNMGVNEFFTSSLQFSSSGEYYLNIYKKNPTSNPDIDCEFSLAYGNRLGDKADLRKNYYANNTPTAAVYSQLRNVLLPADDPVFTFLGGISSDEILVMSFNRNRMKDKIDPGNFQINLASIMTNDIYAINNANMLLYTGSYLKITLIDDSAASMTVDTHNKFRVLNLVSGSLVNGVSVYYNAINDPIKSYGLVYPDLGLIIFNVTALTMTYSYRGNFPLIPWIAGNPSFTYNMNEKAFYMLKESALYHQAAGDSQGITLLFRNETKVNVSHYFINIKSHEYNFSNNPTFVTGSEQHLTHAEFFRDPKTFITTIGLYNDRYELLAVAKLSKPLLKDFSTERHIRVNLQY